MKTFKQKSSKKIKYHKKITSHTYSYMNYLWNEKINKYVHIKYKTNEAKNFETNSDI